MAQDLFSVTVFVVVFREALESVLVVSVLLSLVDQIFRTGPQSPSASAVAHGTATPPHDPEPTPSAVTPRTLRRLKLQVIFGALVGLAIAVTIGAAFIAIWFTQAKNLWANSEKLWEGIFEMIAAPMLFVIGVTMLKMENSRTKWRIKLEHAFNATQHDRGAKTGKWVLFILPLITVLREGLEAVVFVGGVSLGEPAKSIPIAAIVGLVCGLVCGYVLYRFGSRTTFKIFLVSMTNLILLVGAGLFTKAVWAFQQNAYVHLIGASSDDAGGTGPGSYDVRGNVWHLNCCRYETGGWSVFYAIFGWENSGTLGSVLSYVFYWLAVIVVLVYYKFREGRTTLFGWESANGKRRRLRREARVESDENTVTEKDSQAELDNK